MVDSTTDCRLYPPKILPKNLFSFFAMLGSTTGGPGVKENSLGLLEIPLVRLSYVRLGGRKLNQVYFFISSE